jgi:DNA topoisomerase-1
MYEYFETQKEIRKSMTKEEKNELKEGKKAMDEKYGYAVIDGRREKIGNYRMEPPGLFRGRGDHPKTGRIKVRDSILLMSVN